MSETTESNDGPVNIAPGLKTRRNSVRAPAEVFVCDRIAPPERKSDDARVSDGSGGVGALDPLRPDAPETSTEAATTMQKSPQKRRGRKVTAYRFTTPRPAG